MESFILNEGQHYKDVPCGPHLMDLVGLLNLPVPEIRVWKKKNGRWNVKTRFFGRQRNPTTEDITYGMISHNSDMGVNTVVHDSIARLCYRHRNELGKHYFGKLG